MSVDITQPIGQGDGDYLAATISLPDDPQAAPRVVAFGLPGGGLSRKYFDVPNGNGVPYSQSAYHCERGWIFVALDHLGVGQSSLPPPESLTYASLAQANHTAVTRILDRLSEGSLIEGVGPIAIRATVGLGHSMGGCIAIVGQGRHRTFDALGVLGFSAIQTVVPTRQGRIAVSLKPRDDPGADLESGIAEAGGAEMFRWAFYWEDVPDDLIGSDMGGSYRSEVGIAPWSSPTTPPVVFSMMSPGVVAEEAAMITTPVLVAKGERDVIPDLRAEPVAYRSCPHLTIVEIPTMAHMHNLAGTRGQLWHAIHHWGDSVVA